MAIQPTTSQVAVELLHDLCNVLLTVSVTSTILVEEVLSGPAHDDARAGHAAAERAIEIARRLQSVLMGEPQPWNSD